MNSGWKVIGYFEVVFYTLTTLTLAVILFVSLSKSSIKRLNRSSFILVSVFNVFKIVGGITMLIVLYSKNPSEGVIIVAYIFNMASLGFLLRSILPFIISDKKSEDESNYPPPAESWKEDRTESTYESQPSAKGIKQIQKVEKSALTTLVTLVVIAGIVIVIVSSSLLSSDPSKAMLLFKVSSFLFLAAVLLIALITVINFKKLGEQGPFNILILISCALLIVRVVYNIISAFKGMDILSHPSDYAFLLGKYQYYCFMAFIEECLINLLLIGLNFVHIRATLI